MKYRASVRIPPNVYNEAYQPYRGCNTPLQIFFGGSSSGKSKYLAQRLIEDLLIGGRNFLVARKVSVTLRFSVFNEIKKTIYAWNIARLFDIQKSEMVITCANGYAAHFKGLDDPEKIKSIVPVKGVFTDIWLEEATEILEDDYRQLVKRLRGRTLPGIQKRVVFSFNPIYKTHWIFTSFFAPIGWSDNDTVHESEKMLIVKTTYKDNDFLDQEDIDRLLDETNTYYHDVYTLGNWGVLGDLIFENWKTADLIANWELTSTFDKIRHGLDFGYSNDPAAYNKMYYNPNTNTLYIFDEWHELKASNERIYNALKGRVDDGMLICDSAEPKSIAELNTLGLAAAGAKKGKDSINYGIQWLQGRNIVIDKRCQNTINEFGLYQWKKDKEGNTVNTPVDKNNHHIDCIRYAIEDLILNKGNDEFEAVGTLETALHEVDW